MDLLQLIFRWTHILTAIVLAGGSIFMLLVLHPAAATALSDEERGRLRAAVIKRWKMIVHLGVLLFLISGLYNYIVVLIPQHKKDGLYHGLMGLKILLALGVFFIAEAMAGRSKLAEKMRSQTPKFLGIAVSMILVIVLISGFLKTRGPFTKPAIVTDAAIAPVATQPTTAAPEVKTKFEVVLTSFGTSKIGVIKVVRDATGMGLKDAKDLVEAAPKTVKTDLTEADAKKLQSAIETAGGKADVK
jgi:ribosomal protein L7/L12